MAKVSSNPAGEDAASDVVSREAELERLFTRFGWTVTDAFKSRYLNDAHIYNVTNAALRLQVENDELRRLLPPIKALMKVGYDDGPEEEAIVAVLKELGEWRMK